MKKNNISYEKVINPWYGIKLDKKTRDSKNSIINNYRKILNYPLPPVISNNKHSEIIVIGFALFSKLPEKLKNKCHIVIKPRDLFNYKAQIIKKFKKITLDLKIYKKIYNSITNKKSFEHHYIKNIIKKVYPKILIITSTIDPIQRLWAHHAKENGVKVICVQHGLFSSKNSSLALERNIVDYYFSINKDQSKLIQKIIPRKKHRLLYEESYFYYKLTKKTLNICLIGNDYERYGNEGIKLKNKTLKIYKSLIDLLSLEKKVKFNIFYKKHPSEKIYSRDINEVPFIDSKVFKSIDIFFGISSTLLFDLALKKKCAIQLSSRTLNFDKYERSSLCKTISIETIKKRGLVSLFPIDGIKIPCLKPKNLYVLLNNIIKNKS